MMKQTDWVEFTDGDTRYRIRAEYGFDLDFARRNNQDPHFTLTGEIEVLRYGCVWREDSCGCIHDQIVNYFPHLAPLVKWHLVSTREPLHYMANALFWFDEGQRLGWDIVDKEHYLRTTSLENLRKTIVYGARPKADLAFDLRTCTRDQLKSWLANRKRGLMGAFRKEMIAAGVDFSGKNL